MIAPRRLSQATLLAAVATGGCAGSTPTIEGLSGLRADAKPHPYAAALYLSPELEVAEAMVATPDGEATTVWMGDYLRTEIIGATSRAFSAVALVSTPHVTEITIEPPSRARELWPAREPVRVIAPDVIVSCSSAELAGQVIDGGACADCRDDLSFRIALYFEVRTPGGELLASGKIAGQGLDHPHAKSELPLSARFRQAVAEAVDRVSNQLQLALVGSELTPSRPDVEERLVERSGEAAEL